LHALWNPDIRRDEVLAGRVEALQKDLDSRVADVTVALDKHRHAAKKQKDAVEKIRRQKAELDRHLDVESHTYDSNFLARSREVERRIATLEEQIRGLSGCADSRNWFGHWSQKPIGSKAKSTRLDEKCRRKKGISRRPQAT